MIELAAAGWAVRSQNAGFREADIVALTEWLEASEAHADAYRRALSVWIDAGEAAQLPQHAELPVEDNVIHLNAHARPAPRRRSLLGWGIGGAVAASITAVGGTLGPTLIGFLTDFVAGSEADLRYVLVAVKLLFGPLAVFMIWKAIAPYGRAYQQRVDVA